MKCKDIFCNMQYFDFNKNITYNFVPKDKILILKKKKQLPLNKKVGM